MLSIMVGIFKNMENRYLSIDCTKICNNSKRTKMTQNEVIQRTTMSLIRKVVASLLLTD